MKFTSLAWKRGMLLLFSVTVFLLFTLRLDAHQLVFKAEHLEWIKEDGLLIGQGKVVLEYKDVRLEAERIKLDMKNFNLWAEGKVNLETKTRKVRGESLEYNLTSKEGKILSPEGVEGAIFYRADQAYLSPQLIKLSRASFTTCELTPPHYRIKARSVRIVPEDEVIAKDAVLYIGRYPLFWAPIIVRYLREENRIMIPSAGYSDFAGWYVKTGYYFYTSPRLRGTVHLDWRQKKGWAGGVDSSYKIAAGEGEMKSYFIREKDTGDERWRLKLTYKRSFSETTSLKLNLNRVSDEDFLENYFPEEDGEIPPSFVSLDYRKGSYNANFLLEAEVNPFNFEESIQRLPQITLTFPAQKIKGTGLYLGRGMEATNFKKGKDELIRTDGFLEIFYPFTAFSCLQVEPKAGYHLFYYKDKEGKEGYRRIPYQELSTFLQVNGGDKERYTYTLKPTLTYYHSTEEKDEFRLPFDLEDYEKKTEDIHPPNLIKLGVENKLYYKEKSLLTASLTLGYDLIEERKGFSSLEGRFHLTPPVSLLSYIDLYFLYDYPERRYTKLTGALDLKGKSWHLNIGIKKDVDEDIDDFILQGELSLGKKWKLSGYRCYDMLKDELSEERYFLWRDLHCWAAQLSYQRKPETEYSIKFYIKAFPEYWLKFYSGALPF